MDELKKVFDACRKYRGHTIEQAGQAMSKFRSANKQGYSETTLNRFFNSTLKYPDNVDHAVRGYIYQTGLIKAIEKLTSDNKITQASASH